MALAGTETVGDQMETPPSGDEKEKVGNPFWSERAKEEAMVRSMRPSSLPDLNQVVEPGQSRTSTPTPLREALGGGLSGQDVGGLLQGVVEENEKLRRELEELKGISHPGGHGGQRGHGGDVPPALMSLLGRPTTTTGHWGVGGQVMQASNSRWSSEVSGMQAQGQVGRVASGVELLGQGVRINLTSMFERMSLTACGGAGHEASNPLQVQGQEEDLWVSEVHNTWTKVIRFAMGVFKGNTMEDLERRRVRNLWNKEFMAVQFKRVRAMAGAVGRILEELAVEDNRVLDCLVL